MDKDIILITKDIEDATIKVVFNDSNIYFKNFVGLYLNDTLNLLASIDLYDALDIINKSESIAELEDELIAKTWLKQLRGANN